MQNKSEMINRIAELAEENEELKAKIKKYAELNEIDTRDYAALHNENIKLNAIIDGYQPRLQALKDEKDKYYQQTLDDEIQINELYEENERLKEEVETRDNLVEHFRKEAINWAKISNDCIKDIENYKHTLQEIKEIAEALSCKHPEDCWENTPDWNGEVYGCDVADNWKEPSELATCPSKLASAILQIITKAEV